MFLLKSLYYTVIISNTLDYLFQYLLQSFYYIFMLCAATCYVKIFTELTDWKTFQTGLPAWRQKRQISRFWLLSTLFGY